MKLDAAAFAYTVLLLGGLVQGANWLAPYHNLTEAGCVLGYVYDGDTVELLCDGDSRTARLVGFDTPETRDAGCAAEQALGDRATERLRALVKTGAVTLSGQAYDKYGRQLITLAVDGQDVGETLIAEGLAQPYRGGGRINWCAHLGAG